MRARWVGLTRTLLKEEGYYDAVMENCVVQTPTADLLVNAMKAGGLDAAIVYRVNCAKVKDEMPVIQIDQPYVDRGANLCHRPKHVLSRDFLIGFSGIFCERSSNSGSRSWGSV